MSIATQNDTRSTPSDTFGPRRERGELIVIGQVAMATDHGSRPTMLTGDTGSQIDGRSSKMQQEAVTGRGRSARCTGRHGMLVEPTKRENRVHDFTVRLQLKVLCKVLQASSLRIVGWI